MAGRCHEGRGAKRPAYRPFVDQLAAGLDSAAKESVRRAADSPAAAGGGTQHGRPVCPPRGKGFLAVHVLSRLQGGARDTHVSEGRGEVQNDLDFGIAKQLFRGAGPGHALPGSSGPSALGDQVGAGDDPGMGEPLRQVVQVDPADVAAAHDTDAHTLHCVPPYHRIGAPL